MKNLLITLLFFVPGMLNAQDKSTPANGVYFTFSSVRNNKPDLLVENLYKSAANSSMTIRQWSNSEHLYYVDKNGEKASLSRDSIWGFSENGNVYIFLGGKFHKITLFGAISYFTESYPTIKSMAPVVTQTQGSSNYRLLNMETGELYDYNVDNVETLIERDEQLALEYKALDSPKAKRKKLYSYIEKFNAKHKVYE